MTREERDEVIKYSGMLRGIACMVLASDDPEDGSAALIEKLNDIAMDLEAIAKGEEDETLKALHTWLGQTGQNQKGGDDDDV